MAAVFVFGSNLAGRHGKGAAAEAVRNWGAVYGQARGRQGNSYAIPTKDDRFRVLYPEAIAHAVAEFITYARENPQDSFIVTAIGCGLAGYSPAQIAPMFKGAPENVFLSEKLVAALR